MLGSFLYRRYSAAAKRKINWFVQIWSCYRIRYLLYLCILHNSFTNCIYLCASCHKPSGSLQEPQLYDSLRHRQYACHHRQRLIPRCRTWLQLCGWYKKLPATGILHCFMLYLLRAVYPPFKRIWWGFNRQYQGWLTACHLNRWKGKNCQQYHYERYYRCPWTGFWKQTRLWRCFT